ncbi:hypothetical protein [Streptomyces sp. NPDC059479]|uniref:hypothetical protein n=1 Tax=Streptomyces sp. NPDC059479 TaxID=3346848 RepID=UPI00369457FB
MLCAARCHVELHPALGIGRLTTRTDPYEARVAGAHILRLTNHIRGAANAAEVALADHKPWKQQTRTSSNRPSAGA